MIIFNISGGLGNQFFQYAFGRYLSIKTNQTLYINTGSYNHDTGRELKLSYFNTRYKEIEVAEIRNYIKQYLYLPSVGKKIYNKYLPYHFKRYHRQLAIGEEKFYLKNAKKGFFEGYWAHEDYFKEIKDQLKKDLALKDEFRTNALHKALSWIHKKDNITAVHVRRGDYVSNHKFNKIFNVLETSYYFEAFKRMKQKHPNTEFLIFSDDYHWVQDNLTSDHYTIHYANSFKLKDDFLEFQLMDNCNHFIIANSTFSWWTAWLSGSENIIAPKKWYITHPFSSQNIPTGWDLI